MQLKSDMLHQYFSEIDVNDKGNKTEIFYSFMVGLSGEMSEGWETGVGIDASISMMNVYGKGLEGSVPTNIEKKYRKKKWIQTVITDDNNVHFWNEKAYNDAIQHSYLTSTANVVKEEARKFSSYLADNLDEDGGTDIIYWACGENGKYIEEYGELKSNSCLTMDFDGPLKYTFGQATHLLPAVEYFEKKYRSAKRGFFIFITDGKFSDLEKVKQFTTNLAKEIELGKRNPFKAVIIGVGNEIDENQMVTLDDLDTGTDIDIWDHKIAHEMKDIMEIFAELVDENMIVAQIGSIYDSKGNVVKKFNDGVPAKGHFYLPKDSASFTFEIGDKTIKQMIRGA